MVNWQCSEEECVTSELEISERGTMSDVTVPKRIPRRVRLPGKQVQHTLQQQYVYSCIVIEITYIRKGSSQLRTISITYIIWVCTERVFVFKNDV